MTLEGLEKHLFKMQEEARRYRDISAGMPVQEYWRGVVNTLQDILDVIDRNTWSMD